ncbi:hypothetical protein CFIO01_13264 [Colletotrichum fioriniae PJ7]|uniref:Xylanolytic transcriptional activator regulatory domain-containing protein n=1 Tax=Colletotrichum fioriniae PJ7 TaxID=1445577 RepID=A0A010QTD6_9PEZI|nr:hypothetical protein CFIO01_13264 [Colletotrichum fioriniae PJ7]
MFEIADNEPTVDATSASYVEALRLCYQELGGSNDGNPSELATPGHASGVAGDVRPLSKEDLHGFHSPYTNRSTGQTAETEDLVDQLSDRIGSLQIRAGGHIRYYGPTSNFSLAQLPFPDVFAARRTIRNDGNDLLGRLGLNKSVPCALEEHLIKLYFAWQDPVLHVVNQHMFYQAKSRWDDGEESPYFSESLKNALCAIGAAFETRHHPILITFPRSADRAKSLLEIELESPCVATVQALAVLSSHDIGYMRDSRGWLSSGMALRLAFDLGLHVDTTAHVSQGLLSESEAGLRRETFGMADLYHSSWGFYVGQPFRMHTEDITVAKPEVGAYPGSETQWSSYGMSETILVGASLSDSLVQLHQAQVNMAGIMAPVANALYGDLKIPCGQLQEVNASTVATLLAWKENLPSSLLVDLDNPHCRHEPHVLLLHMQYHQNIIHAHRPYMSKTYCQPFPPQGPGSDHARMMCMNAAISIAKLLQVYETNYDLRKVNTQAVGITCSAALLLIFAVTTHYHSDEDQIEIYLTSCFRALDEPSSSWDSTKRARELLLLIRRQWELKVRSAQSDLELEYSKRRRESDLEIPGRVDLDPQMLEDLIDINMGLDLDWGMHFPMGNSMGNL